MHNKLGNPQKKHYLCIVNKNISKRQYKMATIIAAFDSFKGCMTAREACDTAAKALPQHNVVCIPLSDGGEGLLDVIKDSLGGELTTANVHDATMEPCTAQYLITNDGKTAVIEMARVCGLAQLPPKRRNPELTTTYGLGEIIVDALSRGCSQIIMGIGGSATNDAGTGMMQALGYFFIGKGEADIFEPMCGKLLGTVDTIDDSNVLPQLSETQFTIICDVSNPLYGSNGAAAVFAPQKGADKAMVDRLDKALMTFADNTEIAKMAGAGAAGGLGYTLKRYFNAELKRGIDVVLDTIDFDSKIKGAILILTGEGQSDKQTTMGKVASGVLERAQKQGIQVALLSGNIKDEQSLKDYGFSIVESINNGTQAPPDQLLAKATAQTNLSNTIKRIVV